MRSTNNNPAIKKINSYVFTRKFMILQKFLEINIEDRNTGLFMQLQNLLRAHVLS